MSIAERIIHLHMKGEPVPVDLMAHAEIEGHNLAALEEVAELRLAEQHMREEMGEMGNPYWHTAN